MMRYVLPSRFLSLLNSQVSLCGPQSSFSRSKQRTIPFSPLGKVPKTASPMFYGCSIRPLLYHICLGPTLLLSTIPTYPGQFLVKGLAPLYTGLLPPLVYLEQMNLCCIFRNVFLYPILALLRCQAINARLHIYIMLLFLKYLSIVTEFSTMELTNMLMQLLSYFKMASIGPITV